VLKPLFPRRYFLLFFEVDAGWSKRNGLDISRREKFLTFGGNQSIDDYLVFKSIV